MSTATTEDGPNPASGTAQGLLDFLAWVPERNYMNAASASALRTGVKKVLEVESDLDAVEIRHADIEDIVLRFRNRARGKMKDRSMDAYESRFRSSVEMYNKFLNDDKDWMPAAPRTRKSASSGGAAKHNVTTSISANEPDTTAPATSGPSITYPFPIRPGFQGKITLPENLTRREADRISAFIKTLAMEDDNLDDHSPRAITGVVNDDE